MRSFIPCHVIIFGERSDPPRNLRVPDFRDLGSRPRTSRPRNLPCARIKNSQRPPQNTRDKGNLIFHSYSKTDVRAPCARMSTPLCSCNSKYTHNFMHVNQYNDQGLSLQHSNQQRGISKNCSGCPKFMSISHLHKNDKLLQVNTDNSKFTTHDCHQSGCGERV